MPDQKLISVVDDDKSIRQSLEGLLKSLNFRVAAFSSAESFLGANEATETDCLILDIRMPRMSGPELKRELMNRKNEVPIIFITAHESQDVISRLLLEGAVACLRKPFREESLLEAIEVALAP
jgi:FixJ family two-component response regulator